MESYLLDPELHLNAVKDPNLLGGPFLDHELKKIDEIRELYHWTREGCAKLIELADDIVLLNSLLLEHADGGSLESLYKLIPDNLKGMVELVYDTNNHPSVRYLEPLLYKSEFYNTQHQSLAFSINEADDRKFVLSTPRLFDEGVYIADFPFRSELIDQLFSMRTQAKDIDDVMKLFDYKNSNAELIESFFTQEAPRQVQPYEGEMPRIRYYGHACVLIETKEISILIDPVISYDYPSELKRFTFLDLPEKIDYVLLTHNHQDHVMLETLLQIRYRIGKVIVPQSSLGTLQDPSMKLMLKEIGFKDVNSIELLEQIVIPNGSILSIPFLGEHSDLRIDSKTGYLLELGGKKILLGTDSRIIDPCVYERLATIIGSIDILFIGMECDGAPLSWLYGPLVTSKLDYQKDRSRSLSGSDAKMVSRIIELLDRRP